MASLLPPAQMLLDCALIALTEAGVPPCANFLAPGPVTALDSCCTCTNGGEGQLWVSLIQSAAKDPFRGQPCGRQFRVLYRVGLTRCAHTVTDNGSPPTPAQIQEDAEKLYRDQELLLQAVTCCWATEMDWDVTQWAIVATEVLPVQGGCMGQTLDVAVDLAQCSDC